MKKLSDKAVVVKESSTLSITAKAKQMKAQGIDLVSFGAGEPDFPVPGFIQDAAIEAVKGGHSKYTPAAGTEDLRRAIAGKLKADNGLDYEPGQIIVSNGAKHSLTNIFTALLNEGDEVIIPSPYWLSYKQIVEIAGGVAVIVDTAFDNNFKITVAQLNAALSPKTKALLINSPNNPTGTVYSEAELREIAGFAVANDLYVVSDEIYECLIYDEGVRHVSIASFSKEIYERTIVVNGLSKSHAIPGWRLGFTASNKEIAGIMANIQSHQASNPSSLTQRAALAAYTHDKACVDAMVTEYRKRRDYIYERAQKIPFIRQQKPQGAFYLFVDISALIGKTACGVKVEDAAALAKLLLDEARVAVIPCADFGFVNYIRLSYAMSMGEIEKGMDRIEEFINTNFK